MNKLILHVTLYQFPQEQVIKTQVCHLYFALFAYFHFPSNLHHKLKQIEVLARCINLDFQALIWTSQLLEPWAKINLYKFPSLRYSVIGIENSSRYRKTEISQEGLKHLVFISLNYYIKLASYILSECGSFSYSII
jgi:hypothetical protein